MKKLVVVMVGAMVGLFLAACSCPFSSSCPTGGCGACPVNSESLCVKCGEFKGSEKCCAKDAAKCGKCSLIKGSPGCCKLPAVKSGASCPRKADTSCARPGGGCPISK